MSISSIVAYATDEASHIKTRDWFCRETKASLGGVVRNFKQLIQEYSHDYHSSQTTRKAKNLARTEIETMKTHSVSAVKKLIENLSSRISTLEGKISENKTTLLGKIFNIFLNFKHQFYLNIREELRNIQTTIEQIDLPEHQRFACNTREDAKNLLQNNGLGQVLHFDLIALKLSQKAYSFYDDIPLTDQKEIQKLHNAIHDIVKESPAYLLSKHKYNLTQLLENSETIISADTLNEIFRFQSTHRICNEEQKELLLKTLGYETYINRSQFAHFKEFLLETKFSLQDNVKLTDLDKQVLIDLISLYAKKMDVEATPLEISAGKFAEFLVENRVHGSFHITPIKTEKRALQLIRNYGKKRLPTLVEDDLAKLLIAKGFAPRCYSHLSTPEERATFMSYVQELQTLKREQKRHKEESEQRSANAGSELLALPEALTSAASSLLTSVSQFFTPLPTPKQASPPPSSFRMWS